jgi:hypothetical protein
MFNFASSFDPALTFLLEITPLGVLCPIDSLLGFLFKVPYYDFLGAAPLHIVAAPDLEFSI